MSKKEIKFSLFIASDAVDEDFEEYFSGKYQRIQDLMRKKKYSVKDTDIAYRVINHWDEEGLLPEQFRNSEEGWRKFSFIDIIWIHIVRELRNFGLPISSIKQIRERTLSWNENERAYLWFEYYVIKTMLSSMDAYLAVTSDGMANFAFSRQIENSKEIYGSRSFILVSLKEILNSLKVHCEYPEILWSLSPDEQELISTARLDDVDEISIKKNSGKWFRLDSKKSYSGSNLINKITSEIKERGEFAEITINFQGGKDESVGVVRKKKL